LPNRVEPRIPEGKDTHNTCGVVPEAPQEVYGQFRVSNYPSEAQAPAGARLAPACAGRYTAYRELSRERGGGQHASNRPNASGGLTLPRLRWLSQVLFLAFFLFLLCQTEFRGSLHSGDAEIRLPYPVRLFLEVDPLLAISNALATHALYRGMLWSLALLIPTLFLGRFFCGWICPFGTLNHFFSYLRSERKLGRQRIESNR
jgi:hypothetical protein